MVIQEEEPHGLHRDCAFALETWGLPMEAILNVSSPPPMAKPSYVTFAGHIQLQDPLVPSMQASAKREKAFRVGKFAVCKFGECGLGCIRTDGAFVASRFWALHSRHCRHGAPNLFRVRRGLVVAGGAGAS